MSVDGRATINSHRAHTVINRLADVADTDLPIGRRLELVRGIIANAQKAERKLLLQLGVDFAKHLAAEGVQPTGRPVSEVLS